MCSRSVHRFILNVLHSITWSTELPDLIINVDEIQRSAYLEDRSIMFLQCAMEENCLSRSAYEIDKNDPGMSESIINVVTSFTYK